MYLEQLNRDCWFWLGTSTIAVTPYHLGKKRENNPEDKTFKIFSVDKNNKLTFIWKTNELKLILDV